MSEATTTTDWDALQEEADAPTPPRWDHDTGDVLMGTVVDVGEYTGDYGTCKTVTVEAVEGSTENGEPIQPGYRCTWYASRTVAASKLDKALKRGLREGDSIAIKAQGYGEGSEKRDYFSYGLAFQPALDLSPEREADMGPATDDDVPF